MDSAEKLYEPNSDGMIPFDLFVSRKKENHLNLKLIDSSSNLVFSVDRCPHSSPSRLVSDSSGNPLISIYHQVFIIFIFKSTNCFNKRILGFA